jgi:hypothetical protein
MTGFQSIALDAINRVAPTYATAAVAHRGFSQLLDPALTGKLRLMQKAGYPFGLLTPQASAKLSTLSAAGGFTAALDGNRLLPWLLPGVELSLELLESSLVEAVTETSTGLLVVVRDPWLTSHATGVTAHIRSFPVTPVDSTPAGEGSVATPPVRLASPFLLVVGDVLTINGVTYQATSVEDAGVSGSLMLFDVKVGIDGFPELTTGTPIRVRAKPAYRSEILTVPQAKIHPVIKGPWAIDWVSGPVVADYRPEPESELYVEEFNIAGQVTAAPRLIGKNDVLMRHPIGRDQFLFWHAAEGGTNWNGTFVELRAFDTGRVHLWTECRPPLDAAPTQTIAAVVPGFAPYAVLLSPRLVPGSVVVLDGTTKAVIPATEYTVDDVAGTVSFLVAWASTPVIVTFRPRLEWQTLVIPSEAGLELVVVVGTEAQQVFPLGAAGSINTLFITTTTSADIDQLHVTVRRASDAPGAFTVQMGDWQPRGSATGAVRYTLTTVADADYAWCSSGLIVKAMWPALELLRARLDGASILSRYLDNGRLLV